MNERDLQEFQEQYGEEEDMQEQEGDRTIYVPIEDQRDKVKHYIKVNL